MRAESRILSFRKKKDENDDASRRGSHVWSDGVSFGAMRKYKSTGRLRGCGDRSRKETREA